MAVKPTIKPIMLKTGNQIPTALENYEKTLTVGPIQQRHELAKFCIEHSKTQEEILAESGLQSLKYALCRSINENVLCRSEMPGKTTFIGAWRSPNGYYELRTVVVVDVDTDKKWSIIEDTAAPHAEQIIYLDDYSAPGWGNFCAIRAWGPRGDDYKWERVTTSDSIITERLLLPGDGELKLTFFPQFPDGHKAKAFWQLYARDDSESKHPTAISSGNIYGNPSLDEAKTAAKNAVGEWLANVVRCYNELSAVLRA